MTTNKSPDITIVIVSYNTCDLTIACLESVIKETSSVSYEIIVVDNASEDDSVISIKTKFPDVKLFALSENLGFAKANNFAANRANGNYLLLLNPDTVVLKGAIDNLYNFACENKNNRVYGGRTLYGDLSLNPTSCWRQPSLWSMLCYSIGLTSVFRNNPIFDSEAYGGWKRDSVRNVDIVTGCFLLIEKSLWETLGGFDEKFFMYGEDADLCLRAKKRGANPIITPHATIIHYCGASEKVRADKVIRLFKAKLQLIYKHWSKVRAYLGSALLKFSVIYRYFIMRFLKRISLKSSKDVNVWKEIWDRRIEWFYEH